MRRLHILENKYLLKTATIKSHSTSSPTLAHSYPSSLTCPHYHRFPSTSSSWSLISLANAHLKIWHSRHYPIINATQGNMNFLTRPAIQLAHAKQAVQLKIPDILSKILSSRVFSFSSLCKFKCWDFKILSQFKYILLV